MNHIVVGPYDNRYFVAYQIQGTNVYQPVGDTMSQALAVAECERLNEEARKAERKRKRGMKRRFDDWRADCKERGEKPIPEDDPVFAYAEEVGIPIDFIRLAWIEFSRVYSAPEAKNYINWRQHFQNAVRRNLFKLWYRNARTDTWDLTTAGQQLDIELKAKQNREQRQPT
jgi:hypothetical protein